jgi:quercetin dioxygenase-like cupin family protein
MILAMRTLMLLLPLTLLAQRPVPIENEWARVVIANSAPGPKGQLHKHDMNRVMIYLDKATNSLEYQDGKSKVISASPGEVQFDPKGGMHTSQNTGSAPFRVVEIELKKEGGPVTFPKNDMLKVAPKIYHLELENNQVRVIRVKLAPHQKIAEHEHLLSRVIVPLTEVESEITAADGTKTTSKSKPGDAVFGGPARHREENLLDKPVEFLIVEFKG